jgi:hypothetical protein
MRPLCLLFFISTSAFSQHLVSFGVRGGVPMTDFLNAAKSQNFSFNTTTNRYILGPSLELHLPAGFGLEVDALYRHFRYDGSGFIGTIATNVTSIDTGAGAWEFPLLLKYRFPMKVVRPYVNAGVSWDKLSGLTQTVRRVVAGVTGSTSSSNPLELNQDTTRGFVMGAGIDIHALIIHISPEVRFTRWGARHFIDPGGLLHSNLNQAEFLVGITF